MSGPVTQRVRQVSQLLLRLRPFYLVRGRTSLEGGRAAIVSAPWHFLGGCPHTTDETKCSST